MIYDRLLENYGQRVAGSEFRDASRLRFSLQVETFFVNVAANLA
jgi:hypothetical protein